MKRVRMRRQWCCANTGLKQYRYECNIDWSPTMTTTGVGWWKLTALLDSLKYSVLYWVES